MFAQQLAGAIALAPHHQLDQLARLIWRAHAGGVLDDAQAQALAEALHARKSLRYLTENPAAGGGACRGNAPVTALRRPRQRSPDRQRSLERRRRLATSGVMPPALAARFTMG